MPNRIFEVRGTYHRLDRHNNKFEPVDTRVPASDIIEALKIVAEGKTKPKYKFYSAIVSDHSEEPYVQGRYVSADALSYLAAANQRNQFQVKHDGLLIDIDSDTIQSNPRIELRIELRKEDMWVPLEELTEAGWTQIQLG